MSDEKGRPSQAVRPEAIPLISAPAKAYGSLHPYYHFVRTLAKSAPPPQTLHQGDSMVSLCFRSLANYVQEDNLDGLRNFLDSKQVQVDDRDENGTTALMVAAGEGKLHHVRELLGHGADPSAVDLDGWSALLCAAKEGHAEVVLDLLDHGAQMEQRDMGGWTALMWASYKGRTEAVRILVERGADVNAHGNFHISSLLWASGRGYSDIALLLIRHGAKVNVGDKYGTTALVWACRKGHADIVEGLLRAGANVDTAGMYSWTALLVATQGNHVDIVSMLLEHKPNVNALDKDGCTALTIACKEGYYEIAAALLNAGAYINIQDRAGDTNLIHAVKGGHRGVVEALLKKYADVDICGKDRKTAIYSAVEKGNVPIVKQLMTANPDLEIATKDGDTPLLRAVRSRSTEVVQLLLEKKAKVSAADKKGDTALHIAMRARSKAIVEILLRNPKHSQLLYRPNRQAETPYNIDMNHHRTILGQIFGARRLNTNEDNENMLGYDLYCSALADILSEPSLSMPITVGLYAKWGSGKSFLLNKLREEMKNFARQWLDPKFRFTWLLFLILLHVAAILGVAIGLATNTWLAGVITGGVFILFIYFWLGMLRFAIKRFDWEWPYTLNKMISRKLNSFKLILQILFCHPPGQSPQSEPTAQPIRFYFTDQTRVGSTTSGENSLAQMIGSLYDSIETDFGSLSTRLFRAFKPKSVKSSSSLRFRKICCFPSVALFEICFLCFLVGTCALTMYLTNGFRYDSDLEVEQVTTHVVLITTGLILVIVVIANVYTWSRMISALIFSQRHHLRRSIAKLETVKSEGFLQTLRQEVNLMKDMVRCFDSLTAQQTRLVIVVDGLDSCEQDKVLLILDAVHMLFSDANTPFIVILAIDPHVISKAVEMNSRRLFNESNIGGHDYLRNMVHMPFYLQNSGLRKVRVAQQTAQFIRKTASTGWQDSEDHSGTNLLGRSLSSRRLSSESALMSSNEKLKLPIPTRKGSRKLKMSESIGSSLGSNLNKVGGAQDLNKMLLTDDYFNDVNPRSMRRLMNVVYVTGRLLKAFQIDFNWYHLASWINITEQWPFRTSWIILHYDLYEDQFDDNTTLKSIYEKVRPQIPTTKDSEPLLELDRDEKKFDIFLSYPRSSGSRLLVSDLKIFLPFTINLDPYIKKVIKEEHQSLEDDSFASVRMQNQANHWQNPAPSVVRRTGRGFNRTPIVPPNVYTAATPIMPWPGQHWPETPVKPPMHYALSPVSVLPPEVLDMRLSTMSVDDVCKLINTVDNINSTASIQYKTAIRENNINGRVLLHCDLDELKQLFRMTFGDWELFRVVVISLREQELTILSRQDEIKNVRFGGLMADEKRGGPSGKSLSLKEELAKQTSGDGSRISSKQSTMEKQVTLEEQMICGALQTLNEEACEDVLEETELEKSTGIPQTSLIPPSPDGAPDIVELRSRTNSLSVNNEADFVILQTSPTHHIHCQPVSISESVENISDGNSSGRSTPKTYQDPVNAAKLNDSFADQSTRRRRSSMPECSCRRQKTKCFVSCTCNVVPMTRIEIRQQENGNNLCRQNAIDADEIK